MVTSVSVGATGQPYTQIYLCMAIGYYFVNVSSSIIRQNWSQEKPCSLNKLLELIFGLIFILLPNYEILFKNLQCLFVY